jgi:hypothetical protein
METGVSEGPILLFVGRAAPSKGLDVLVEGLAKLRESGVAAHVVCVGDTSDVYAREVRRCIDLARCRGVAGALRFVGEVSAKKLREAYRSADLLVMPSRHEAFGLPVLEAMACGLPVLAARTAALGETVGAAGLTFRPDDPDDLARQAADLLRRRGIADDPLPTALRKCGLDRAQKFARESWRSGFLTLVERVLHAAPRRGRVAVEIAPRHGPVEACMGEPAWIPVWVENRGTLPLLECGPGAVKLTARPTSADADVSLTRHGALPCNVPPGSRVAAAIPILALDIPGEASFALQAIAHRPAPTGGVREFTLVAQATARATVRVTAAPVLDSVRTVEALVDRSLANAEQLQRLPQGFADDDAGWWAGLKRWIRRKLLGRFQYGYVDVLSRRQSDFNGALVTLVRELVLAAHSERHRRLEVEERLDRLETRLRELETDLPRRGGEILEAVRDLASDPH